MNESVIGCAYCNHTTLPEADWDDGLFSGIVGNTEYSGCPEDPWHSWSRKVSFCPFCGRKLEGV